MPWWGLPCGGCVVVTAPSRQVRAWTYLRDGFRCLSCGARDGLSWQHREASGSGGRGVKAPELTTADGVTLCLLCNEGCEGAGQDRCWYMPGEACVRVVVGWAVALELLDAAGNLTRKKAR